MSETDRAAVPADTAPPSSTRVIRSAEDLPAAPAAAELSRLEALADDIAWIDTAAALAEACASWRQQPLIGLDTEFIRTNTFYPIPGLIQVASGGRCYLLDPSAINDFSPFVALLEDPQVVKVLHACSEDLELFAHSYGAVPRPLFDTQVACAFLDMGLSIGYQRLLNTLYGIELDKEETLSDWLQRPLTAAQQRYAALDVVYLELLYQQLATQLKAEGKYEWVLEECEMLALSALDEGDPAQSYLQRFKQGWKLTPKQLAVLKALSSWRETESRKQDMPRSFLLHNNAVMAMALRPPRSLKALSQVERMRRRTVNQHGQLLLDMMDQAWQQDEQNCPPAPPRPLPTAEAKKVKRLKQLVNQTAERLALAPEVLVRRKDLEQLIRNGISGEYQLPQGLQGWRQTVIGEPLLALLRELNQVILVQDIK